MATSSVTMAMKSCGTFSQQRHSSYQFPVKSSSAASSTAVPGPFATSRARQCQVLKVSGLRPSMMGVAVNLNQSSLSKCKTVVKEHFVLRVVAKAQKIAVPNPHSLFPKEGHSDINSVTSTAEKLDTRFSTKDARKSKFLIENVPKSKLSIEDVPKSEFEGKTVLVRADLNVPLDDKQNIGDDSRIRASIPTIEYLMCCGARVVLASHLGRPENGPEDRFSLKPVGARLSELLKKEVKFTPDCIGPEVEELTKNLKDGEILLLENVRFYKEEEKYDIHFSQKLSKNIDYFVNDAFGTTHRAHSSSTFGIAPLVSKKFRGILLQKQLDYLAGAIQRPARPFVAIVGGSKVSSKIAVIESLLSKSDKVILGGGMVFTFLKSQGYSVGGSLVEEDKLDVAIHLTSLAKEKGVELIFPVDVLAADKFAPDASVQDCDSRKIPDGMMGLDIGPKSIEQFKHALKGAKTVVWHGPMGEFESDAFAKGTLAIANAIADLTSEGAITIIGGDSAAAIEKAGLGDKVTHVDHCTSH